jgi:membrane protease YdiL (CAAX protease family)
MPTISSETSNRRSSAPNVRALTAWGVLVTVLIALAFVGRAGGETDRDILYKWELSLGTLVVYGVLVALTFAIGGAYRDALGALGLRRFEWRWVWIALGLIVIALVLGAALEPWLHAGREQGFSPERWRPERADAFLVNALVAATFVPFAEELFFRGLGIRVLGFLGSSLAIVLTALAFGLGHGILAALPPLVFFGLALGWVRLRSESVWPGIAAHGAYNGVAILVVYLQLTN